MAYDPLAGRTIYNDMAKNLREIGFDVMVDERYNPVIPAFDLMEGAPPPLRTIDAGNMFNPCHARYPASIIVDAMVTDHYIKFVHLEDMQLVRDWLQLYLNQWSGVNIEDPETQAFNSKAKKALMMLNGNIKRKDDDEARSKPRRMSIGELMARL